LAIGLVGQRRAVRVIGRAADKVLAHVEGDALRAEPVDDLAHLGHDFGADPVAGQDKQCTVGHAPRDVVPGGIKTDGQVAQMPRHHVELRGPVHAKRDVRLVEQEVLRGVAGHEFHGKPRVCLAKPGEDRRQEETGHQLRRGEAERPRLRADLSLGLQLQCLRRLRHPAQMRQKALHQRRGAEAARVPVKKRPAQRILCRADLSAEGRLAEADTARGCRERAVIGDSQNARKQRPVEGGGRGSHSILNISHVDRVNI
jgi:hypothetical protein